MIKINEDYKKKLYVRANRRGIRELDLVLGYVATKYMPSMSDEQILEFEKFLDLDDSIIYKYLMNQTPKPEEIKEEFWNMVLSYQVANPQ